MHRGSGTVEDDRKELKAGSTAVANIKNRWIDASVPISYALGLEHQHPIVIMLWGH